MTRSPARLLLALLAAAAPLHAQQPWITGEVRLERDNQVRTALHAATELGRYLGPNATLALGVAADRIGGDGPDATSPETSTASVGLRGTWGFPSARLGLEVGAGALLGAPAGGDAAGGAEPVLHAALRRGLGRATAVRLRAARERYTATLASLDTLVLAHTVEVALDRSAAPGWAGEAVARRTDFGDANPVITAYAWVLAPLSRSTAHSLRAGYAVGWQDAAHSTWAASGVAPSGAYPQQVPGRYSPYYSPHDVLTHSALLDVGVAAGSAWILADGSVGVRATETTPVMVRATAAAVPALGFHEREFRPYRARVSVVVPADDRTSVTVSLGYDRTAYYRTGTLRLAFARSL
ncbi:MAG: hypothetical protein Q8N53_04470 [Longimicrobiales bacterium]|nr:hypothetical protein [Longimicrobiales bacterium]